MTNTEFLSTSEPSGPSGPSETGRCESSLEGAPSARGEHRWRGRLLPASRAARPRVTIGAVARTRANNFDALRLLGALLVLVSHAFAVSGRPEPTIAGVTLGAIGVFIFFGISGFLITKSWVREPRPGPFFAKRALRILPALFVVSVLTAYLIGPLVTTASVGHYFDSPLTHAYALRNATLRTDYLLPGVFAHNPYPRAVNGSLWTLPTEARAYVAVAFIGLLMAFLAGSRPRLGWLTRHRRFLVVGSALLIALGCILAILKLAGLSDKFVAYGISMPTRNDLTGGFSQWYLFLAFGVGAVLYLCRDRVVLRWDAFIVAIAVWVLASHATALPHSVRTALVPAFVIPYATLVVAFRGSPLFRRLTAWGDISYGVYVWAFPIEQIIALKFAHAVTPAIVIAVSAPVTCLLGAASWFAVERHALRLKPHARTRSAPAVPGQGPSPTPHAYLHPSPEAAVPVVGS